MALSRPHAMPAVQSLSGAKQPFSPGRSLGRASRLGLLRIVGNAVAEGLHILRYAFGRPRLSSGTHPISRRRRGRGVGVGWLRVDCERAIGEAQAEVDFREPQAGYK